MGERRAVMNKIASQWRRGSRPETSAILHQLVKLTGWHRDHARARLRSAGEEARANRYDPVSSLVDSNRRARGGRRDALQPQDPRRRR